MSIHYWSGGTAAQLQRLVARSFARNYGESASEPSQYGCAADGGANFSIETFGPAEFENFFKPWNALADRALEANVFMEPGFAAPAAIHLPSAARPLFVAVWRGDNVNPRARMIGLMAIEPRGSIFARGLARSWLHRHSAHGAPLIDSDDAGNAIEALLEWTGAARVGCYGLIFPRLIRNGPLFNAMVAHCVATDRQWLIADIHERAILRHDSGAAERVANAQSKKRRKEFARRVNRLREHGLVEYRSAETTPDLMRATELFMALEQKGWKGRRGTALLSNPADATFMRAMTRLMAREDKCRIDWIALDGRPIAMSVILKSGGQGYFWKTAFDEAYAQYSPGVLLTRMLTERQLAANDLDMTDSCAISDHPMIDKIWPDRQRMADLTICCDLNRSEAFAHAAQRIEMWRRIRLGAKYALANTFGYKIN